MKTKKSKISKNNVYGIFAVILALAFGACSASAQDQRLTGGDKFKFTLSRDGTYYTVAKGTAQTGDVVIPAYYRPDSESTYLPVTIVGSFQDCANLTSITIPNTVTSIVNASIFNGCTSLTSITLPASVTSLPQNAFRYTVDVKSNISSITVHKDNPNFASQDGIVYNKEKTEIVIVPLRISGAITLPSSITSIGDRFRGCTALTSVTIPNSVTSIGLRAFEYCTSLTSVTLPDSLTTIGDSAFGFCSSLTSVTIPNSVTTIGGSAFSYCTGLTGVTIPNSVTTIDNNAFYGCTGLTSVTIPDSVTTIKVGAFSGCTGLTSLTIPDSVTTIEGGAFSGCTGITEITIPASVTSIEYTTFNYWTSSQTINFLARRSAIYWPYSPPNRFYGDAKVNFLGGN